MLGQHPSSDAGMLDVLAFLCSGEEKDTFSQACALRTAVILPVLPECSKLAVDFAQCRTWLSPPRLIMQTLVPKTSVISRSSWSFACPTEASAASAAEACELLREAVHDCQT